MLSCVRPSCSNLLIILQVLCLDECTANVDNQTAFLLQNTISAECKGMTVLTIAHRISTVMKMDNILVLDQGKLVSLCFWNFTIQAGVLSNSISSKFRSKKETQKFLWLTDARDSHSLRRHLQCDRMKIMCYSVILEETLGVARFYHWYLLPRWAR